MQKKLPYFNDVFIQTHLQKMHQNVERSFLTLKCPFFHSPINLNAYICITTNVTMKKILALCLMLCLSNCLSHAQVKVGILGGFNFANMLVRDNDRKVTSNMIVSMHLGGTVEYSLSKSFTLQPSLVFSGKGRAIESLRNTPQGNVTVKEIIKPIVFEIPIHLSYKISFGERKLVLFGGPYWSIAVSGQKEYELSGLREPYTTAQALSDLKLESSSSLKFGNSKDCDLRRTDIGLNCGLGYEIKNGQIKLQYGLGLTNLDPMGESKNEKKNRVLSICISYFF